MICVEEPENGIHPARLKTVIHRLRQLVADPQQTEAAGPLSQLILSSHSPVILSCLDLVDMVFFDQVTVVDPTSKTLRRKTRMRPLGPQDSRDELERNDPPHVSQYEVDRYLSTVGAEG